MMAGCIRERCPPTLEQLDDLLGTFDLTLGTEFVVAHVGDEQSTQLLDVAGELQPHEFKLVVDRGDVAARLIGLANRPEVTKRPDFTHKRTNHELRRPCERYRAQP